MRTLKQIPLTIRSKCRQISAAQFRIKTLISEIEKWAKIEDVYDDGLLSFGMQVDEQGACCSTEDVVLCLQDYLKLKESEAV